LISVAKQALFFRISYSKALATSFSPFKQANRLVVALNYLNWYPKRQSGLGWADDEQKNKSYNRTKMKQKHNVTAEKLGIEISSGTLAGLASGAVTISMGETNVFVSATAAATLRPGQDFFPLTVDYREKFTAAGRFPGGYFKREGKPTEKEILTSRLCDRPLRPLFPKGFLNEVQVIGYLFPPILVNEADVLMVNGASAAIMISDIPWNGPIGCVRLGQIDGEFVVNPTNEQMYDSTLDLIYVGSEKEMMMIEGSADQIPEDRFVEALEFAHEAIQDIIEAQRNWLNFAEKPKRNSISLKHRMMCSPFAVKLPVTAWKKPSLPPPNRSARLPLMRSKKMPPLPARKNSETILMKTM
jgi:hypothetical protein